MLNRKKLSLLIATTLVSFSLAGTIPVNATPVKGEKEQTKTIVKDKENNNQKLTIMMYIDADNNLEPYLLNDIEEMKKGYVDNPNLNVIILVDRTKGESEDSSVLGENFTDTRMYKLENHKAVRIDGGNEFPEITTTSNYEANMGDANTLKKFINSCKANYKADKYMLLMSDHGGGARKHNKNDLNKAICWDDTNNDDCIYMSELSDVLTKDQSVDLLAFDACLMGTAEVGYQFRPNNGSFEAKYLVASSPSEWGYGYQYDKIFSRLRDDIKTNGEEDLTLGGKEKCYNPSTVTGKELGALLVEEQRDSTTKGEATDQELSCYDLSKSKEVKTSVDALAKNLSEENKQVAIENLRGYCGYNGNIIMHYFDDSEDWGWRAYPYFDLYDLCSQINNSNKFSEKTKGLAKNVIKSVDNMVLYSFGGTDYQGFKDGKNGLSIFLPDGNKVYRDKRTGKELTHWQSQGWYSPLDTTKELNIPYGKLSWCKDGIDPKENKVGNWFELLDSWFDSSNDKTGGVNHYQW